MRLHERRLSAGGFWFDLWDPLRDIPRLINIQDINVFESLAPIAMQPKYKLDIVKHLQTIDKNESIELYG